MDLLKTRVFAGFRQEELGPALWDMGAREVVFPKDSLIYHEGQSVREMGIVMEGSALSGELRKMKREGLIDYHLNHLVLRKTSN